MATQLELENILLGDRAGSGLTWIILGSVYNLVYYILEIYIQDWSTFLSYHLTKLIIFFH